MVATGEYLVLVLEVVEEEALEAVLLVLPRVEVLGVVVDLRHPLSPPLLNQVIRPLVRHYQRDRKDGFHKHSSVEL